MKIYFGIVGSEIKYIGSGADNRSSHLLSGRSSCIKANEYFFNGGGELTLLELSLSDNPIIRDLEHYFINKIKPEWNEKGKNVISSCKEDLIREYLPNIDNFIKAFKEMLLGGKFEGLSKNLANSKLYILFLISIVPEENLDVLLERITGETREKAHQ